MGRIMHGLRYAWLFPALLAAGAGFGVVTPVRADGALVVQETRLHTPPDSHEPQRALFTVRNTGPDPVTQATVACTFTGAGGAVLDTPTTAVPVVAAGATAQAETIYYGWPRASGAACRLAAPH
jgi:hypothetical protein